MSSKPWYRLCVIALLSLAACGGESETETEAETAADRTPVIARTTGPPNIIIILADDMGYGDIGAFYDEAPAAPNLDSLAASGMRFTDFYSAAPVCSPARAALLTGYYPPRTGITKVIQFGDELGLNPDETTIADVLHGAGYQSACIGKWHLGNDAEYRPTNLGFDEFFGFMGPGPPRGRRPDLDALWRSGDSDFYDIEHYRNNELLPLTPPRGDTAQLYTDEAVAFIERNQAQPWFLYLAHTLPHVPIFVSDDHYVPDPLQAYQAAIAEIDASLGRIRASLERLGLLEHTLIIFTSDNGPWFKYAHHGGSTGPFRGGKATTSEGGMRVPMIASWPGHIAPGTTCNTVTSTLDLLPTLATIAGADVPAGIDGLDMGPLMSGEVAASWDERPFYYVRGKRVHAVRRGQWKLRYNDVTPRTKRLPQLYDLSHDPHEDTNLYHLYKEKAEAMIAEIEVFERGLVNSQQNR